MLIAVAVRSPGGGKAGYQLTGLDEDLHVVGVVWLYVGYSVLVLLLDSEVERRELWCLFVDVRERVCLKERALM